MPCAHPQRRIRSRNMRPTQSPQEWLPEKRRREFGRGTDLPWLPLPSGRTPEDAWSLAVELAVAQRHHHIARAVRHHMVDQALSNVSLGQAAHLDATALGKTLNGRHILHLREVAALEHALGVNLIRPTGDGI